MCRYGLPGLLAVLLCALDLGAANDPKVRAWQDALILPMYVMGEPSPTPQFGIYSSAVANYPYPLLNNLTKQRQDRVWRALHLENEYLSCRILPDLGGHLYSCRDKRNNREMFYSNPVIKPADVGLRGAWAAMGIESNFPVGHTRVSISPVDFALQEDPDGSGRAIVEDIDRITGMEWRVEYILRPGSTVLEQRVLLYNRSALRWPYYWWANASVAFDDPAMRMILPANVVSTHAAQPELLAWPVKPNEKDGTLVANHKIAGAWFAYGCREPFFALYKPASRSGVAHYAETRTVSGKKLWLWGSDQDAWVKTELTDNFPSYVEIQGGVFQNQNLFEFLQPEQTVQFSEFWIPVQDLGGVTRVTRDAILSLQRSMSPANQPVLQIELSATRAIQGAHFQVISDGKPVFENKMDLGPAANYSKTLDSLVDSPYTIQLTDSAGAILLKHVEGQYDADRVDQVKLGPVPKPYPDGAQAATLMARGNYYELQQQWTNAWSEYSYGLRRFNSNPAFQKAAGNVVLNSGDVERASRLLAAAVAADAADVSSAYSLGLAQVLLGQDAAARQNLSRAVESKEFGTAAAVQLALISARAKDDAGALTMLKRAAGQGTGAVRLGALQVAILRRSGHKDDASQLLNRLYAVDPADNLVRVERVLLGSEDPELWNHLALDGERVLNLVDEYFGLGSFEDALQLLAHAYPESSAAEVEPGAIPAFRHPMLSYYRAFCHARLGQDAAADLTAASGGTTRYVFPNRWTSVAVLNSALKANPSDARAHLLLGRLYMSQSRPDDAIAQWQEARRLSPSLPELARDLGRELIEDKKDMGAGRSVILEGLRFHPRDPELRQLGAALGIN